MFADFPHRPAPANNRSHPVRDGLDQDENIRKAAGRAKLLRRGYENAAMRNEMASSSGGSYTGSHFITTCDGLPSQPVIDTFYRVTPSDSMLLLLNIRELKSIALSMKSLLWEWLMAGCQILSSNLKESSLALWGV
jgi:hypothetical protein